MLRSIPPLYAGALCSPRLHRGPTSSARLTAYQCEELPMLIKQCLLLAVPPAMVMDFDHVPFAGALVRRRDGCMALHKYAVGGSKV